MKNMRYLVQLGFGFLCYLIFLCWPEPFWYTHSRFGRWVLGWAGIWGYRLPWDEWRIATSRGAMKGATDGEASTTD